MLKIFIIFFILNFYNIVFSSEKEKIITKMQNTNNLSFNFVQTISEKKENGNCIIKYPKKIYCEYDNHDKKIMVSNGRSLVIKNNNNALYYIYPLKRTPLELLLDKDYLLSKIKKIEPRKIDSKYMNFEILENGNIINIFFNIETSNLIGWQNEDIYQNLSITFISNIRINEEINEKIFILPKNN
jgi:outer membrane lipoprotein-sorting protein|tara:strand:+ start:98 stop:652 length:555 start_codon:yes stop_codon:yes gene_type:complete